MVRTDHITALYPLLLSAFIWNSQLQLLRNSETWTWDNLVKESSLNWKHVFLRTQIATYQEMNHQAVQVKNITAYMQIIVASLVKVCRLQRPGTDTTPDKETTHMHKPRLITTCCFWIKPKIWQNNIHLRPKLQLFSYFLHRYAMDGCW